MHRTYICWAHDAADLLHGVEVRAQASVHCEDLLINNGGNWQAVEAIGECLPKLDVVSSFTLVVKSIDTVDRSTLMVTTKNEEVLRILNLVRKQEADGLERLLASIDVVS